MESPKVPVSNSDTYGVSRKHDVWARITSFWWQSWSYCPSTDGQVRAKEPSLAWCSIAWDQAPRGARGWGGGGMLGGRRKKETAKARKIGEWSEPTGEGPFHPPKSIALARFAQRFFCYFTPFFPLSPTAEPGPRLGGASIVQVSSLTWWSLRVHPGTSRIYNFTIKRLGCLFGPEAFIGV